MSYRKLEQHLLDTAQDTFHHAGSWLSSTLALLPLLLLVLGLGLKTIPASEQAPTSSSYLWMAGWLVVLWLLSSLIGDFGPATWSLRNAMWRVWVDLGLRIILLLSLLPVLYYSLTVGLPGSGAGTCVVGAAFFLAGLMVGVMTEKATAMTMGGILALGLACLSVVFTLQTMVMQLLLPLLIASWLRWIGPVIALAIIGIGTVLVLGATIQLMQRVESDLALDRPSWKLRFIIATLFLAYATLIWYAYGGGWRLFL